MACSAKPAAKGKRRARLSAFFIEAFTWLPVSSKEWHRPQVSLI